MPFDPLHTLQNLKQILEEEVNMLREILGAVVDESFSSNSHKQLKKQLKEIQKKRNEITKALLDHHNLCSIKHYFNDETFLNVLLDYEDGSEVISLKDQALALMQTIETETKRLKQVQSDGSKNISTDIYWDLFKEKESTPTKKPLKLED